METQRIQRYGRIRALNSWGARDVSGRIVGAG
jgi:hypothetical protein